MNDHHKLAGARKHRTVPSHAIGPVAPNRRNSAGMARNSSSHEKPRKAANSIGSGSHGPSRRRLPSRNSTDSKGLPDDTW